MCLWTPLRWQQRIVRTLLAFQRKVIGTMMGDLLGTFYGCSRMATLADASLPSAMRTKNPPTCVYVGACHSSESLSLEITFDYSWQGSNICAFLRLVARQCDMQMHMRSNGQCTTINHSKSHGHLNGGVSSITSINWATACEKLVQWHDLWVPQLHSKHRHGIAIDKHRNQTRYVRNSSLSI